MSIATLSVLVCLYALGMLVFAAVLAVPGLARAYNERRRRRRARRFAHCNR